MMHLARRLFVRSMMMLMAMSACLLPPAAADAATRVERVVSPGGIEAWLVRQSHLPVIAMNFAFRGGTSQDRPDRAGTAQILAAILDEGAGDLDSEAFQGLLDDHAVEMSFSAGRDTFGGSLRMLTEHADAAFRLMRLALTEPRFDDKPLERIRQSVLAGIRRASTNPNAIAGETFWSTAYPGHPYGRRPGGTRESVEAIARVDLADLHRRLLARGNLKVAVVGDISPEALALRLDEVFGGLPASPDLVAVPGATLAGAGERRVIPLDTPQTVISFGLPGLKRDDPDFIAAFVMNQILGGGSMTSRLFAEVREKRGLAYSVSSGLSAFDASGVVSGGAATRNERAGETIALIEAELARMGESGPTDDELDRAKSYLIGSWALRFETSNAIAANLLRIQLDGYGPDYVDRRNELIEAVAMADVRRVARRLLVGVKPLVVMVGKPEGF